jgi:mannose-6-phosphate isomerase-like protein (cupin superfamily)
MIKQISNKKKLLAIIIDNKFKDEGIKFFTPDEFSQQLGYMSHPKGYIISPHVHNHIPREVQFTNEVLFIRSGKVRVDFYDDNQNYLQSSILNQGDVILLASGGHGFEMLEPAEIIEVKQGPYIGDQDKTRFKSIDKSKIFLKD